MLYSRTHCGAPNGRIIAYPLQGAPGAWGVVVPEREDRIIEQAAVTAFGFVTVELQDAVPVVCRYARDGASLGTVELPELGTIHLLHGTPASDFAVVGFSSFVRPATLLAVG
jgi:protease II